MPAKTYDAVVIGSGPAGSVAAKELTERGLEVLLLEAGPNITPDDFRAPTTPEHIKGIDVWPRFLAGLAGQHVQARATFFSEQTKRFFVNDRQNPYKMDSKDFFLWLRGRQLGGRFHTYGRVVQRMSDYDFKAASRDGHGNDWPFAYRDLAPYYDHVERFLGVYGSQETIPNLPNGIYLKTPQLTSLEQAFKIKVESTWPERSVIPARYVAPNLKRVPSPILAGQETGRLTIQTDAVVKQVTIDPKTGKASGAVYIDRKKKSPVTVSANVVVLCASTIESVRILLNSACARHPNGLGNSSGVLGHYFMDQCPTVTWGSVPSSRGWEQINDSGTDDPFYPSSGCVCIPRFHNLDKTTNATFARGFCFQGAIGRFYVPDNHPSMFGFMGMGEALPSFENCISIDPNKTDAWNIPIPRIRISLTQNERALLREQLRTIKEMLLANGYRIELAASPLGLDAETKVFPDADWLSRLIFRMCFAKSVAVGAAIHECGGARMGSNPNDSVLNEFNQCWDVPNLFVTDGSCFVSNGTVGPSLTIMALTVRACEYIAAEYRKGTFEAQHGTAKSVTNAAIVH